MTIFKIIYIIAIILAILNFIFREQRTKNTIVDSICVFIFFTDCTYLLWFSLNVEFSVIGVIGAISLAVSEIFLAFFERILKEFREVKEKIDSCEMSIRTDIWHAREELGKDILNIPEKTVKTEMEFFGTVYDTLEDASKNKNKE